MRLLNLRSTETLSNVQEWMFDNVQEINTREIYNSINPRTTEDKLEYQILTDSYRLIEMQASGLNIGYSSYLNQY